MKVQIYILGLLLRYGPQHGYMLKQTIEKQISEFAKIKLPTIYYHLEKMNEQGYISAKVEKDGARPEKTVYKITKKGEEYIHQLLKKVQSEELNLDFPFDAVIFFKERIDRDELNHSVNILVSKLEKKLKALTAYRDEVLGIIPDVGKDSTMLIFNHHIYHLEAELKWLKEIKD